MKFPSKNLSEVVIYCFGKRGQGNRLLKHFGKNFLHLKHDIAAITRAGDTETFFKS